MRQMATGCDICGEPLQYTATAALALRDDASVAHCRENVLEREQHHVGPRDGKVKQRAQSRCQAAACTKTLTQRALVADAAFVSI